MRTPSNRGQRALLWIGLLLMLAAASGLPLDLLRFTPLMPTGIDWPGLIRRTLALGVAIVLARRVLAMPVAPVTRVPTWYGYAAFACALPYPVLRTVWALGGTIGLDWQGAAGDGWLPWLFSIPWLLAAVLSLLLVSTSRRLPRRVLLTAGWTATAIVAMIGPVASWSLVGAILKGEDLDVGGIATWVFALFYGSWLLWAIAAAATTRSYQLRTSIR